MLTFAKSEGKLDLELYHDVNAGIVTDDDLHVDLAVEQVFAETVQNTHDRS